MDDSNQVQELLSRSYATPEYLDDADLEAGKIYNTIYNMLILILILSLELEMLGTESFEVEEERPSYLDDLAVPSSTKIGSGKLGTSELGL